MQADSYWLSHSQGSYLAISYLDDFLPFYHSWREILVQMSIATRQFALELCCGRFPKVGWAIDSLGLAQQIGFVDASDSALKACETMVKQLYFHSETIFYPHTLSTTPRIEKAAIVTGNHIIDDLLIYHYQKAHDELHINPYESKEYYIHLSDRLVNYYCQKAHLETVIVRIAGELDNLTLESGKIIITEYTSYYEKEYGIHDWPFFRLIILQQLEHELLRNGYRVVPVHEAPSLFTKVFAWEKVC